MGALARVFGTLVLVLCGSLANGPASAGHHAHMHGHAHGHGPIVRFGFSYGFPIHAPHHFPAPVYAIPGYVFLHPFMFIRLRLSGITHRRVMSSGASHWLSPRRPKLNETGTTAPTHVCITPLPGNVPADGCACRHSRPRARYPKQAACSNRRAFRPLRRMRHKAEVAQGSL